jgi:diaminopimelate epimerase
VAAVSQRRLDPGDIEVRMQGGSFRVRVSADLDVVLRGPVEEVGTGELTEGFLRALADG